MPTKKQKKEKPKKEEKFRILSTFNSNLIRVQVSEKDILLEFAQQPEDDDGFLLASRIFFDIDGFDELIEALNEAKKRYEKHFKKKK